MTNNFEKTLGKGGFGTVFFGTAAENIQVAVKLLSPPKSARGNRHEQTEDSMQSFYHQQFQAEVRYFGVYNIEDHIFFS